MHWFSFHGGHSGQFCRHASGTLREVVERAVEEGFTDYGLTEHAPRWRSEDLLPDETDLSPVDLLWAFEAYVQEARLLQEEFSDRIEILVGFESEAVPPGQWLERMQGLRNAHEIDYVAGSVHHVGGRVIDLSAEATRLAASEVGGQRELDILYFERVAEVAERLRPEVVTHFDLIRKYRGERVQFPPETWVHIERALEAVREAGSLLDVNAAPARRGLGPVYPQPAILERARRLEIPVTLGDDGHGPADVGVGLEECVAAAAGAGYSEIHRLRRKGPEVLPEAVPIDEVAPLRDLRV